MHAGVGHGSDCGSKQGLDWYRDHDTRWEAKGQTEASDLEDKRKGGSEQCGG